MTNKNHPSAARVSLSAHVCSRRATGLPPSTTSERASHVRVMDCGLTSCVLHVVVNCMVVHESWPPSSEQGYVALFLTRSNDIGNRANGSSSCWFRYCPMPSTPNAEGCKIFSSGVEIRPTLVCLARRVGWKKCLLLSPWPMTNGMLDPRTLSAKVRSNPHASWPVPLVFSHSSTLPFLPSNSSAQLSFQEKNFLA